ncbi:MAG: diguanylate cyclase [Gallionellaceae bacterium]|nr:diguanylate cyclase [Gallionellaceae bacterium]
MSDIQRASLLVVDDAPENIEVLRRLLSKEYNVKIAISGEQALKVVAAQAPDLILLDVMMPGMDGYEVCRRLKADPATHDIPVIFITAQDDADDEIKGLSLGAIDYLTKPIHASIAAARIRNHLELKRRRDELQELNSNLEDRVREEVARSTEHERLNLLGKLFDMGHEAVLITDADTRVVMANKAFSDITGYTKEEVLGQKTKIFQSGRHDQDFYQQMWRQLSEHGFWQGEIWNKRKDDVIYPEWLSISVIRNGNGQIVNYISTFTDISDHMKVQEKFRHMAMHDPLTGLPNRAAFSEQLERDMVRAERHKTNLAVVMMDLDYFKNINDTLGHAAGDLLLIGIGGRVRTCLRADDFICRLGGDEFVIILHDINSTSDVAYVCDKLLQSISEPFLLNGHTGHVTPSMGIVIFPADGISKEELMANADTAMYRTKKHGRANYTFYA